MGSWMQYGYIFLYFWQIYRENHGEVFRSQGFGSKRQNCSGNYFQICVESVSACNILFVASFLFFNSVHYYLMFSVM